MHLWCRSVSENTNRILCVQKKGEIDTFCMHTIEVLIETLRRVGTFVEICVTTQILKIVTATKHVQFLFCRNIFLLAIFVKLCKKY